MLNALTVDVEDYFQVSGFESSVARHDWDHFPSRVVDNTRRLLDVLAQQDVTGTFFVLGWVADKYPDLVRQIDAAGHEIGSHSYWHRLVYELDPREFREDLRQSRRVLEDAIGRSVTAFRAPSFSIIRRSLWALEILAEEGFEIDSSIFPIRHDRYGIPDAPRKIHSIPTPAGNIVEIPMSVARLSGVPVPAGGGGYFRLYPYTFTRHLMARINASGRPVVFYIHPWELDPGQPVVRGVSFPARRRHRINLASTAARLQRLLGDFRFGTVSDVLQAHHHEPPARAGSGRQHYSDSVRP